MTGSRQWRCWGRADKVKYWLPLQACDGQGDSGEGRILAIQLPPSYRRHVLELFTDTQSQASVCLWLVCKFSGSETITKVLSLK